MIAETMCKALSLRLPRGAPGNFKAQALVVKAVPLLLFCCLQLLRNLIHTCHVYAHLLVRSCGSPTALADAVDIGPWTVAVNGLTVVRTAQPTACPRLL